MLNDVFLAQIENEENVLVCLRIIIELHKQFRPPLQSEASSHSKVTNPEFLTTVPMDFQADICIVESKWLELRKLSSNCG